MIRVPIVGIFLKEMKITSSQKPVWNVHSSIIDNNWKPPKHSFTGDIQVQKLW